MNQIVDICNVTPKLPVFWFYTTKLLSGLIYFVVIDYIFINFQEEEIKLIYF